MEPVVVKISGNVADEPAELAAVAQWVARHSASGQPVVLVHGGGRQINRTIERMGLPVTMVEGRRVTDAETLEALTGVLGGLVNKHIVSVFRGQGIRAVGLTGVDGNLTTSHKRPPLQIKGEAVDFGLVGEIDSVDPSLLQTLLDGGMVPVVGCLTWSEAEGVLNINADTFANRLAVALGGKRLVAVMDVGAVLDAGRKPLTTLTHYEFHHGVQAGWIKDGMIPKLTTAFKSLDAGLESVLLTNAAGLLAGTGTELRL